MPADPHRGRVHAEAVPRKALPENARRYVEPLSGAIGCEIGIVATGPDRQDTVFRGSSRIARWFEQPLPSGTVNLALAST